jgi:hypothetical protein
MIKVCLDFDGVLTRDPMAARNFIVECLGSGYEVLVNSWRCENEAGLIMITRWLQKYLDDDAERVKVARYKPGADLYIDDKAFRFVGRYPDMAEIFGLVTAIKE